VKLTEAFANPDLDREIKWHCKYARQNGIQHLRTGQAVFLEPTFPFSVKAFGKTRRLAARSGFAKTSVSFSPL